MDKLAILLPAFNESEALPLLLDEIFSTESLKGAAVVVINDASTDDTLQAIERFRDRVVCLDLPINLGIGGALQTGYRYALKEGFSWALQLDGDGQHDPRFIASLMRTLQDEGADLVIGSRFVDNRGFQSTRLRRWGIAWFSFMIRALTGKTVLDTTSGFRLAGRKLFSQFAAHYPVDYPEPEVLAWTLARSFKVVEVPVAMRSRQGGRTSIRGWRPLYYMIKVTLGIVNGYLSARMMGEQSSA